MREINKQLEFGKIQKADLRIGKVDEQLNPQFCGEVEKNEEEIKLKDFSNPAEVLGRSQVNKKDNLKTDVAFGITHPEVIANADKFFDIVYAKLQKDGDPQAYEKASSLATAYAKELS